MQSKARRDELSDLKAYFKGWRKLAQEGTRERERKCKPIHTKWLKLCCFKQWKESTLDSQKNKLALEFYKYKIFQRFKQWFYELQQFKAGLVDKELKLTLTYMKKTKLKYFNKLVERYQYSRDRKGLVQMLLEMKFKQSRRKLLSEGFRAFKVTVTVDKNKRRVQLRRMKAIFNSIRKLSDIKKRNLRMV